MLFALSGHDDAQVREYMAQLNETGRYEVSKSIKDQLGQFVWGRTKRSPMILPILLEV